MGVVDAYVFLIPLLRPILTYDLVGVELDKNIIKNSLIEPISRRGYNQAILRRIQILATRNPSVTGRSSHQSGVDIDMGSLSIDSAEGGEATRVVAEETVSDKFTSLKPIIEDENGSFSYEDNYTGGAAMVLLLTHS